MESSDDSDLQCLQTKAESASSRLFDIYSTAKHTALIFGDGVVGNGRSALLGALDVLPRSLCQKVVIVPSSVEDVVDLHTEADYVFKDADGYAHKNFGLSEGGLIVVLVRPDAVVGAVALSDAGVHKYVSTVFSL